MIITKLKEIDFIILKEVIKKGTILKRDLKKPFSTLNKNKNLDSGYVNSRLNFLFNEGFLTKIQSKPIVMKMNYSNTEPIRRLMQSIEEFEGGFQK